MPSRPGAGRRSESVSAAAVLLLFTLFMLLAVGVLTAGLSVYQRVHGAEERVYLQRSALSYLANRVRQADAQGAVSAGRFGGADALILRETFAGSDTRYYTYVYVYNGQLRELFFEEGVELPPESGTVLMPLEALSVALSQEGLLQFSLDYGQAGTGALTLWLRCRAEGGEAP
ncbi:MAG: DUF4860 domain-containing protein [Clostridiales bacterium]|nr:DUF4860 domain-containing protein [Clostridiales bacterium]